MANYKTALRVAAKAALQADPAFASHTFRSLFGKSIDHQSLPAIAIATPRERRAPDGLDSQIASVDLLVVLKCKGGDTLEADLDTLGDQIEAVLIAALGAAGRVMTDEIVVSVDGAGETLVGTLAITFSATEYLTLS